MQYLAKLVYILNKATFEVILQKACVNYLLGKLVSSYNVSLNLIVCIFRSLTRSLTVSLTNTPLIIIIADINEIYKYIIHENNLFLKIMA